MGRSDHRWHVGTSHQNAIAAEGNLRRCNRPPLPHYGSRPVSRPARLTSPKRMLGKGLLTTHEPRFLVIKARRYSRETLFGSVRDGSAPRRVRSKPKMEWDSQKFRGFELGTPRRAWKLGSVFLSPRYTTR
jgi:hypothetical protein